MPSEEKPKVARRSRKKKGSDPARYSRRRLGEEPSKDEVMNSTRCVREMKNLTAKGGRGGKIHQGSSDWEYFPRKGLGYLPIDERRKHNKEVFQELSEVLDVEMNQIIKETRKKDKAPYQLVKLKGA